MSEAAFCLAAGCGGGLVGSAFCSALCRARYELAANVAVAVSVAIDSLDGVVTDETVIDDEILRQSESARNLLESLLERIVAAAVAAVEVSQ